MNCYGLQELDLGNWDASNITSCSSMFYNCENLKDMVLPSNMPIIDEGMFSECINLGNVYIPESILYIEYGAFSHCSDLKTVSIPSQVVSIGEKAFNLCEALTTVIVKLPEPLPITKNTFSNYANATLYVPKGSRNAYMEAENWKLFSKIVEMSGVRGDVNNDGKANVTDATCLVSHILGMHTEGFIVGIADINGDGQVTVTDVTALVNIILGKE